MKMTYDQDSDCSYFYLTDGEIEDSESIEEDIVFDYDKEGRTLGIEFIGWSTISPKQFTKALGLATA